MRNLIIASLLLFPIAAHGAFELSPVRTPAASSGFGVGVASNGAGFYAIVQIYNANPYARGIALHPDGRVASADHVVPDRISSVARFGDHYVVASTNQLTELAANGETLRTLVTLPSSIDFPIKATTNGEHILVPSVVNSVVVVSRTGATRSVEYGQQAQIAGSDDDEFFLTFLGSSLFRRLRVDGSMATLDLGTFFDTAVAASDNTNVLVVTADASGVRPVLINPSGAAEPKPIAAFAKKIVRPVSLVWTGREYVLTALASEHFYGELGSEVIALRIAADGSPIGEPASLFRGGAIRFDAAAFNGNRIVVGVTATANPAAQAYSISFQPADLANVNVEVISVVVPAQLQPKVASSDRTSLVVWREPGATTATVKAALLGPAGRISVDDLEIAPRVSPFSDYAVVHARGSYLVVWADRESIRGRRISEAGQFIDTEPFTIASGADALAAYLTASRDGDRVLVVWARAADTTLRTATIEGNSTLSTHFLTTESGFEGFDSAFDGSRYLVVWRQPSYIPIFPGPPPSVHVAAAFFNRDGAAAGGEAVLAGPLGSFEANVGARPGAFLVTFVDKNGTQQAGIVSGTSKPALGQLFAGPQFAVSSKPRWNGSEFLSAGVTTSDLLMTRRDGDGRLVATRALGLSLPTAPDAPLLAGGFVIVQQNVFTVGQFAAKRLVVYRESELVPTRRRIGR